MVAVLATPVTWVGMDVHMSSISAAATIGASGELVQARLTGDVGQAVQWARQLPGQVRVTYEAHPFGAKLNDIIRISPRNGSDTNDCPLVQWFGKKPALSKTPEGGCSW